jgi:hypothetical protein
MSFGPALGRRAPQAGIVEPVAIGQGEAEARAPARQVEFGRGDEAAVVRELPTFRAKDGARLAARLHRFEAPNQVYHLVSAIRRGAYDGARPSGGMSGRRPVAWEPALG